MLGLRFTLCMLLNFVPLPSLFVCFGMEINYFSFVLEWRQVYLDETCPVFVYDKVKLSWTPNVDNEIKSVPCPNLYHIQAGIIGMVIMSGEAKVVSRLSPVSLPTLTWMFTDKYLSISVKFELVLFSFIISTTT